MGEYGHWVAIYFVSFQVVSVFLLVQLFVAVILENFTLVSELEEMGTVTVNDLEGFAKLWGKYDPMGTGNIQLEQFGEFYQVLKKPLGLGRRKKPIEIDPNVIGVKEDVIQQLFFADTLVVLTRAALAGDEIDLELNDSIQKQWKKAFGRKLRRTSSLGIDVPFERVTMDKIEHARQVIKEEVKKSHQRKPLRSRLRTGSFLSSPGPDDDNLGSPRRWPLWRTRSQKQVDVKQDTAKEETSSSSSTFSQITIGSSDTSQEE